MQFEILPPVGNSRGPLYTESLLRAMHRSISGRRRFSLLFTSKQGSVGLGVDLPDEHRVLFLQELQDAYPGSKVKASPGCEPNKHVATCRIRLSPDLLCIRTHEAFLDLADDRQFSDPVAGLLAAIRTGQSGRIECRIELQAQLASRRRIRQMERQTERLVHGFQSLTSRRWWLLTITSHKLLIRSFGTILGRICRQSRTVSDEKTKSDEQLFECWLTVSVGTQYSELKTRSQQKLNEIVGTFGRFIDGNTSFCVNKGIRQSSRGFLMTPKEIATLWHPLTASGDAVSRVQHADFKEVEPPLKISSRKGTVDTTILGRVKFRQQRTQFGIGTDDLRRHMLAIGKTGCGKSTFLMNVVRQQIEKNRGVVLIDPHGQLAEEVLDIVPRKRTNDVIYFDASEVTAPVRFNPLSGPDGTDPTLIADGVLTSFKNVFGFDDGAAPRLLHIFRNCLLTLIGTPDATLMGVQRLLVDSNLRRTLVGRVSNQAVREFWLTEFNQWNDRDRTQYIASLQNKLGAFTTNERLQLILNPAQKGIHLREVMDGSKVFICNLSKGTVGHDASTLLGSLLLSSLQIAAMSRANIPENDRADCVVVVDEFHSYLSEKNSTMADALAESRKYRTSYVLSTQMLEQLDSATLAGVLGNCGSTLCMTVGPRDAEILTNLLGCGLTPDDLMQIPKYHGYLKMLIDGAAHTFSMTTLAPPSYTAKRAETIRKVSRERYGQPPSKSTNKEQKELAF